MANTSTSNVTMLRSDRTLVRIWDEIDSIRYDCGETVAVTAAQLALQAIHDYRDQIRNASHDVPTQPPVVH